MRNSLLPLFFSVFFAFTLHSSTKSEAPFSVNVLVEEGENVTGWEKGIFGEIPEKNEKKSKDKKDVKKAENNVDKKGKDKKTEKENRDTSEEPENELEETREFEESPDPDVSGKEKEFAENDPKWGRYYGDSPEVKKEYKQVDDGKKEEHKLESNIVSNKDDEFIPIDILLWSQGGDGYLAMINTGVRVSYLNMYSTLSVGTDYSASLDRPMSFGVNLGGYYRINDFLITADLGYEKIWDFGDNPELNDYALGLKAGLSYSIWSWFAISAGAGINYNVLKDTTFGQGRFSPMFFGGFEFNLIK